MHRSLRATCIPACLFFFFSFAAHSTAQTWIPLNVPANSAPAMLFPSAVYNPTSNRMVAVGFYTGVDPQTGAWILTNANGIGSSQWTQAVPSSSAPQPSLRSSQNVTYDPGSNSLLLFGGDVCEFLTDSWVLQNADGTTGTPQWKQLFPTGTTPSGYNHGMGFNPASNRLIAYLGASDHGGCPSTFTYEDGDVWVLTNANGTGTAPPAWIKLSPSGPLPAGRNICGNANTYNSAKDQAVFWGGCNGSDGLTFLTDVWLLQNASGFTGTPTWVPVQITGTGPIGREWAVQVYDPVTDSLIINGGLTISNGNEEVLSDTWVLPNVSAPGAHTWQQLNVVGGDGPGREVAAAVYDQSTNRLIEYGGAYEPNQAPVGDTRILTDANGVVSSTLSIQSISPVAGGNAGSVTVQVFGTGFQSGAAVSLTGLGGTISGSNTSLLSSAVLSTTLDLTNATPGTRNVIVNNPDGSSVTLPDAFSVAEGGSAQLTTEVIGRTDYLSGKGIKLYIALRNLGNTDATLPIVEVSGIPTSDASSAMVSMQGLGAFPSMQAARQKIATLTDTAASSNNYSFDFDVVDSDGTVVSPTVWTNSGLQRFGFVPINVPPGTVFLLGLTFIFTGDQVTGTALLAQTAATVPGALPKCSVAVLKDTFDVLRIPVSNQSLNCLNDLYGFFAGMSRSTYETWLSTHGWLTVGDLGKLAGSILYQLVELSGSKCAVPIANVQSVAADAFAEFDLVMAGSKSIVDCYDILNGEYATSFPLHRVQSLDPNNKSGPLGTGAAHFISSKDQIPYLISFENEASASAPAQTVVVTDQIDPTLDLDTLTLGLITLPGQLVNPESQPLSLLGAPFSTTVDLRPSENLLVKVTGSLDLTNRILQWTLEAVSKPPQGDHEAGDVEEGLVDGQLAVITDSQVAEVSQPSICPFNLPTFAVTT